MHIEHILRLTTASLDNMASWYRTNPPNAFAVTGMDAVGIAHTDMAEALRHAEKGEYWYAPNDWRGGSPNGRAEMPRPSGGQ
jgi:hypothetical protein